jgi:hypothetical protein
MPCASGPDQHRARAAAGGPFTRPAYSGGLLPPGPDPSLAHVLDLIMLMALSGRERTSAQLEALAGQAGYSLLRDTALTDVLPWRVLEFRRG